MKHEKGKRCNKYQVDNLNDLLTISEPITIPPSLPLLTADSAAPSTLVTSVISGGSMYVPMPVDAYSIHGAVYTGRAQIGWIGQLADMPGDFCLHADAKYKLHHGSWILFTLGTHHLRFDNGTLSTSFVPLMYLFCKEHETDGASKLVMDAANCVSLKYFGKKLFPGAASADHAASIRKGFVTTWPDVEFGQCYPHLIRKMGEGEYFSKTWEHSADSINMLRHINMAGTTAMKGMIVRAAGDMWDSWGTQLDKFWDSNLADPWDCWSICDMDTMLSTPSNQAQESWHKQLLQSRIPGLFKGSTAKVVVDVLPQLIKMDGILIPDKLCFHVSDPSLPDKCM